MRAGRELFGQRGYAFRVEAAALRDAVRRVLGQRRFPCCAIVAAVAAARDELAGKRERDQSFAAGSRWQPDVCVRTGKRQARLDLHEPAAAASFTATQVAA